jgi:hypothetical protein
MRSAVTILESALSHDLTTLATFKDTLGVSPQNQTRDDAMLRCIRQATGAINKACGRPFGQERVSERFLFDYNECVDTLVLSRKPVLPPIESVTEGTTLLEADRYDLFDPLHGLLLRTPPSSSSSYRYHYGIPGWSGAELTVVYTAGYVLLDSLPEDVERACLMLATGYYRSEGRDTSVRSVEVPDVETITFGTPTDATVTTGASLPDDVRALLRPYLKVI